MGSGSARAVAVARELAGDGASDGRHEEVMDADNNMAARATTTTTTTMATTGSGNGNGNGNGDGGTPIVLVRANGEMVLQTGGDYSKDMLQAFNVVLLPLGCKLTEQNETTWMIHEGKRMRQFFEGVKIPPSQTTGALRAKMVVQAVENPLAHQAAVAAANALKQTAKAQMKGAAGIAMGMGMGMRVSMGRGRGRGMGRGRGGGGAGDDYNDHVRRLQAQGRAPPS